MLHREPGSASISLFPTNEFARSRNRYRARFASILCTLFVVEPALSSSRKFSRRDLMTWSWQVSVLAVAYVISGILGMQLAHYKEGVTLVWPPSGLALAALILFGRHLWPGIFIGTLLVSLGNPAANFVASLGIATGNSLESVVAVTLLIRVADFRPTLERMQDGAAFLLIGALGCTLISATFGVSAYYTFGYVDATSAGLVWLIWWLGNLGGALILTPVLLMMVHGTPRWIDLVRRFETWLAFAWVFATSLFAFFGPNLGLLGFVACIAPIPVLVWVGTRLGPRAATLASSIMILIGILGTARDSGPFVLGTTAEAMFLLWSWAMLIGVTSFTLTAVVEQRNFADRRYRVEEAERLRTEKEQLLLLERERLTREMHDGLGGQLVSVLAMVERGQAAPNEVAEGLRRAIDDIRIVIDSLDPETTDLPSSLGKLRARLEPLLRRNGINLTWKVEDEIGAGIFQPEAGIHILRIIQEAVTNTLRHADANNVEVEIASGGSNRSEFQLSVRDDGIGFPEGRTKGGRGLGNLESRARELGAELRIESGESGTRIDLTIPLSR